MVEQQEFEEALGEHIPPADAKYENDEIHKQWFRTKDKQGFLGIRAAFDIGKVAIDIGELGGGGGLAGATLVYTNVMPFATYMRAVATGRADQLFPANNKMKTPAGAYVYYGGSQAGGKPVSRILKVLPDGGRFQWKTGHFDAKVTSTGAFMPTDMTAPLSANMIMVSSAQMAEISARIDLALHAYAAGNKPGDILLALSGGRK